MTMLNNNDLMLALPAELVVKVLRFLTPSDLCRCSTISPEWKQICDQESLWFGFTRTVWKNKITTQLGIQSSGDSQNFTHRISPSGAKLMLEKRRHKSIKPPFKMNARRKYSSIPLLTFNRNGKLVMQSPNSEVKKLMALLKVYALNGCFKLKIAKNVILSKFNSINISPIVSKILEL
ncbi:hypothetical protein K7432_010539 [Basidiobolus ranarum]|uniref:F-box domain-containing protein n=1 Tax=Basidiobolus ranarum TaxID=34480 RepID=A0ABR2WNM4_9FUNG